jgi:Adenine deaminase C-terminal domain
VGLGYLTAGPEMLTHLSRPEPILRQPKQSDAWYAGISGMESCGCKLNNAYMQHSLLTLVVIPGIRISDLGIIDVTKFKKVDLFV